MLTSHPLAQWNKTIVGLIGIICNIAYAYNVTNPNAIVAAILALAAALGVFAVPNSK